MIDALAFKGIWAHHGFDNVLKRLEYIQAQVDAEAELQRQNHPKVASAVKFELTVRFLSDTLVIAAHSSAQLQSTRGFLVDNATPDDWAKISTDVQHNKTATEFVALKVVVGVIARALAAAVVASKDNPDLPMLNYRGAISYGEYLVHENFLIGQAVDDCGALFEKSEGAFVAFHRTAAAFWERCQEARDAMQGGIVRTGQLTVQDIKSYMVLCEVLRYSVPFKEGEVDSFLVNPLSRFTRHLWPEISGQMLAQMAPRTGDDDKVRASIERKREYTAAYLEFILTQAPTCFPPAPPTFDEAHRILSGESRDTANAPRENRTQRPWLLPFLFGASIGLAASLTAFGDSNE